MTPLPDGPPGIQCAEAMERFIEDVNESLSRDPRVPLATILPYDDPVQERQDRGFRRANDQRQSCAAQRVRQQGDIIIRAYTDDLPFAEELIGFVNDDRLNAEKWETLKPRILARINQCRNAQRQGIGPDRPMELAELDRLSCEIPALDKKSGDWVKAGKAAEHDGVGVETLGKYRGNGRKASTGMFGVDPDGRFWRRIGTKNTDVWYFLKSLKKK